MRKRGFHKIAAVAATAVLLFTGGCGGGDTDAASAFGGGHSEEYVKRPEQSDDEAYEIIEGPDGEFIKIPKNTDGTEREEQPDIIQQGDPAREETRRAYQSAMQTFLTKHTFPESGIADDLSDEEMEKNSFAVCDVDSDGKDELIILYVTPDAESAKTVNIYGYDAEKKELYAELAVYPTITFYVNGKVKAFWMYKGLSGDGEWPYTMYEYNMEEDRYDPIMYVDSWDKALHPSDYSGEAFPDEIDSDGCGTVYLLTEGDERRTVSKSEFDKWYAGVMGREIEMMITYLAITQKNIEAITEN